MKAINETSQSVVARDICIAATLLQRVKGLLGKKGMQHGEGLLITPCKGIHTVGMRFDIDVAILDRDNRVIALHRRLRPYRLTPIYFRASSVLELPAGALDDASTKVGDVITIV